MKEAYVQQRTSSGWYDDEDGDDNKIIGRNIYVIPKYFG